MNKLVAGLVVLLVGALALAGWQAREAAGARAVAIADHAAVDSTKQASARAAVAKDSALATADAAGRAVAIAERGRQFALEQLRRISADSLPPTPADTVTVADTTARRMWEARDSALTARLEASGEVIRADAGVIARLATDTVRLRAVILAGDRLDVSRLAQIAAVTKESADWKKAANAGRCWFGIPCPVVTVGGSVVLAAGQLRYGPSINVGIPIRF